MNEIEFSVERGIKGDAIGPELILQWYSPEVRCHGVVVVDSTVNGKSAGGTRMLSDITTAEIFWLARDMSYKYAMLGRPRGGGKAGIWAHLDMEVSRREDVMRAFGRAIRPLAMAGTFWFPRSA